MNRQEAIRILKKELEITKDIDKRFGDFPEHREALEMAISSLETEPCEYCISRHKAIVMVTAYEGKSAQIEALEKLSSVYPKSDAIPRERIEQMVAEIKDRRSKHNCSCSDCLDIIDKYTKEAEQ